MYFKLRVPGHEIAGIVVAVGSEVTKFTVGERAGIGCMVDSCRTCAHCNRGLQQFCKTGSVGTYNGRQKYRHCAEYNEQGGNITYGGYSQEVVVDENYALHLPENLPFHTIAPLLCAGITTYSPLIHYGLRPGQRLAVAGLGGLGHMAVKFGVAFGAHTTVISRGTSKREGALNDLNADAFIDSTDAEAMKSATGCFDMIIDTIACTHDIDMYIDLLNLDGKLILVGIPESPLKFQGNKLVVGRRIITASLIGGIQETQDMLDFCGRKNITCDVEVIDPTQINDAYERTVKGDVKYRFVIDTSKL